MLCRGITLKSNSILDRVKPRNRSKRGCITKSLWRTLTLVLCKRVFKKVTSPDQSIWQSSTRSIRSTSWLLQTPTLRTPTHRPHLQEWKTLPSLITPRIYKESDPDCLSRDRHRSQLEPKIKPHSYFPIKANRAWFHCPPPMPVPVWYLSPPMIRQVRVPIIPPTHWRVAMLCTDMYLSNPWWTSSTSYRVKGGRV